MSGQRHSLAADWQASQAASQAASREARRHSTTDDHLASTADDHSASTADDHSASTAVRHVYDPSGDHPDDHPDLVLLGAARHELAMAREIRARELVASAPPAAVAAAIRAECEPVFGTTWIRAYRLALGIALADVVAQVRAWYEADGRSAPRFSETLLSAYESGQKRPGPEYMHYLCAAYRADPQELGYEGPCLCGRTHHLARPDVLMRGVPVSGGQAEQRTSRRQGAAARAPAAQVPAAAQGAAGPPGTAAQAGADRSGTAAQGAAGPSGTAAQAASPADAAAPRSALARASRQGSERAGRAYQAASNGRACLGAAVPARRIRVDQHAPETLSPTTTDGVADDDELRRMLLRLIADGTVGVDSRFLGAIDRIRRRMDEALLGATVSATMIDQWEEATAAYGRQYMTVPPLRLLCDALLDFGDVRRICEERQPIEFVERLCRLAGRLACLAGMIMINLGDQRLARSFFRTARTATDETGDRRLRAWVASREALVPLYYGDPREAAAMAGTAIDLAGRYPCVAAVMAPVVEARALARLAGAGRREALTRARAALDRARDALGDLPDEDRADTAFGYTERQLLFHEGDTLVTLGDCQGAERAFAHALRLYSPAEFVDSSLVTLGQARCLLAADEPEQALRLSQQTLLGLDREHRTEIVVQAARALGKSAAVRHADLPAVRAYREALLTA
jgi:tetratricopeptide (TPR) repeat protein